MGHWAPLLPRGQLKCEVIKAREEVADARMRSHLDQVGKLYWKVRRAGK